MASPGFSVAAPNAARALVVLAVCLADRGADRDLEDLVFAQSRGPDGADVVIGDFDRRQGPPCRPGLRSSSSQSGAIERGPAHLRQRRAAAAKDAGDEFAVQSGDVGHRSWVPFQVAAMRCWSTACSAGLAVSSRARRSAARASWAAECAEEFGAGGVVEVIPVEFAGEGVQLGQRRLRPGDSSAGRPPGAAG